MKKLVSMILTVLLSVQLLAAGVFAAAFPFTDVSPGSWYYDAVAQCYGKGAMKGVSAARFAPDSAMTRAMFAQALANTSSNYKAPDIPPQFSDVKTDDWHYGAMQWMASLHIMTGTGSGYGTPDRAITRAEAAAMLYRYSLLCDTDYRYMGDGDVYNFEDYSQIPRYARNAVAWAASNGIMLGTAKNVFSPNRPLTRAQAAMLLTRISGMDNPVYETYEYIVRWKDQEFVMDLPVSWKTECVMDVEEELDESGRLITFYSKANHIFDDESGTYAGKLLSFYVIPAEQPGPPDNARNFYVFTHGGADYNVYESRPSSIQWMGDPKGYILMYERLDTIMKSVRPTWV